MTKILIFDLETAPKLAFMWGMWNQNVSLPMMERDGYLLSWAAKWYGEDGVMSDSLFNYGSEIENEDGVLNEGKLVSTLWELLDEADMLISYNGNKFDIPVANTAMFKAGLMPPNAGKSIDLLAVVRRKFRFASNKLDFISKEMGIEQKKSHEGFELWRKCMLGDEEAWKSMVEYNEQDIIVTEQLYDKVRPWIKNHPNVNVIDEHDHTVRCPSCASSDIKRNGFENMASGTRYQRYRCNTCGTNARGKTILNDIEKRRSLTVSL